MVCGDGGNDIPMFYDAGLERGCIVGNVTRELSEYIAQHPRDNLYMAKEKSAGGILEALLYWKFLEEIPPRKHRL